MKRRRGNGLKRCLAAFMTVLMVVGVVPLDFAQVGVQEVKAEGGTKYVLDMSNITDHTGNASATWSATDNSGYFTVYSKKEGGSTINAQGDTFTSDDGKSISTTAKFTTGGTGQINNNVPYACIGFKTSGAATVTVCWYKTYTDDRQLKLFTASNTDGETTNRENTKNKYVDTFTVASAGTYYVGSSSSGTQIFGIIVEEQAAGDKASAQIQYNGAILTSLTGSYAEGLLSTIKSSESQLIFTSVPSSDELTITTASDNVYSGTASWTVSLDTDSQNVVVKDGIGVELVSIPYVVEGYLNAPAVGGDGESYSFEKEKKVFGDDEVTIADKSSPKGYILLSKLDNESLNVNGNSHGLYVTKDVTFTVKVPAESQAVFSLTGCRYNSGTVTMTYGVDGEEAKVETLSTGQMETDPSKEIKYINTGSSEDVLKIKIGVTGSTYIHDVSYKVEEVPNTVSGSVGTSFAGSKLTFSASSDSAEATIAEDGTYTVDLKRGLKYTVSIDSDTYSLSDTVDLTGATVGQSITKDFTPELIPTLTRHPENATAIPVATNMTTGSLNVKELGQTLVLTQDGGSVPTTSISSSEVSFYTFPATSGYGSVEADVVLSYSSNASTNKFVALGAIKSVKVDDNGTQKDDYKTLTTAIRNNNDVVMLYSKSASELMGKSGNTAVSAVAEEKVHMKIVRTDKDITLSVTNQAGKSNPKTLTYDSTDMKKTGIISSDSLMYGFILNSVTATVTNMVYKDSDGNVIYDQNTYYDPMGTAPVVSGVSVEAAADRTKITVNWTADAAKYDGKYVLQVLKPSATDWVDVDDELTETTYEYAVSATDGGDYKFRVCRTLGNSETLNIANRNTWVESSVAYIEPALGIPVVTLDYVSPANSVSLSWTESEGANRYEVYRRSSDETEATPIATVEGTSYTDTTVTAEVPYYYSVKSLSSDNFSPLSEEVWTLPTDGHAGNYDEDVPLYVTKRSYNTVFTDKITIEGVAGAPGTVSVYVNDTKQQSASIANAYGTFAFDGNITLAKGRNEVKLVLEYGNGLKLEKTLNYVYLSNYDYVVDASYAGTDGDSATYGVPTYKTVSAALAAAGNDKTIFVRNGDYNEQISVDNTDIRLIGEDSEKTRIYFDVSEVERGAGNASSRFAFSVKKTAAGFSAENMTIENTHNYIGDGSIGSNESAEAFYSESSDSMLIGVRLLSNQDTIQVKNGSFYLLRCYILGNVDFMWGQNCSAVFDDCDIVFRYAAKKNSGYCTAFGETTGPGIIYNNCRFTSESSCGGTKYYLGRPYNSAATQIAFVNCYMGSVINKNIAYTDWSGKELSTNEEVYEKTGYYECGTYGQGFAVNINRKQISQTGAATLMNSAKSGMEAKAASLSSTAYSGDKYIDNAGFVESSYNSSDKYSAYESDDSGLSKYNAEGFASTTGVTGGGLLKETNSNYYKVATANEFLDALTKVKNSKGVPSVIEITADLNLGYKEITDASSYASNILATHNPALMSTTLMNSGVSKVYIQDISNLTIFSSNASSIKHAALDIKQSSNVIIRNIKFDELWEWDEDTSGDYDTNDWDYMTIENASTGIWVDHCTFYKSYDGVVDIKTDMQHDSAMNITVSWCQFMPGSENDTFFNEVMSQLESNPSAYPYYKSLLDSGMTKQQIRDYAYGQKKTHLLGQDDKISTNSNLHVTFANNYYYDSMDRMPRVRFGTAHVYNCVMDAQELFTARTSITNKDAAKHIVSNGASSTCNASVLLENCYINGIINALNSGNGNSPTGYINAINSLYYINNVRYKLEAKINNTATASDRILKVTDADTFKSALGYSYVLRDAATLSSTVVPYTGAGVLNLSTLQWEKSAYIDEVEASSGATYDNSGLPESNYSDELGNESNSNNGGNGTTNGGTGNSGTTDNSGSDDDYDSDDDSSSSGSDGSQAGAESSAPQYTPLTAEQIPGATATRVDNVDFAQIEGLTEGASAALESVDGSGYVKAGVDVAEGTAALTADVADKLAAATGEVVTVFASEDATVSANVLAAVKSSGKTLSVGVVNASGKVTAIVTFDGKSLTGTMVDFILKITYDVQNDSVTKLFNNIGISSAALDVIDFGYLGSLPGVVDVAVNVADKFANGTKLALYYYNESTGNIENQFQLTTVTDGYAEFAISHCSKYVLVEVAAAQDMLTTSTITAPKTGDMNHIVLWLMLMGMAAAAYFGCKAAKSEGR